MTYEAGLKHDSANEELIDGMRFAQDGIKKDPGAAMAALGEFVEGGAALGEFVEGGVGDPELGAIMRDPVVVQVLINFKANPAAAAAQMQNPEVAAKVHKIIVAAGLAPPPMR